MKTKIREVATFFGQSTAAHRTTGAIAPSSAHLARAITRPLAKRSTPSKVLEVGPGTGAVTRHILPMLRHGEEFTLYEINPVFANYLRDGLNGARTLPRTKARVTVVEAPIQTIPRVPIYDYAISGLPFNNFEPKTVREILEAVMDALKPGGVLSYFEYAWLRDIKIMSSFGPERRRIAGVKKVVREFLHKYQFAAKIVYFNLPPAYARHLRKP